MTEDDRVKFDSAISQLAELWRAIQKITNGTPSFPWSITHMHACANALIDLCPLQPGDVAELVDPPEITREKSWGYLGAKHLFTVGRRVEIQHITWRADDRCYAVGFLFENETFIHPHTHEECAVSNRGIFTLGSHRFRKVTANAYGDSADTARSERAAAITFGRKVASENSIHGRAIGMFVDAVERGEHVK
jgi:hypothetical protein